MWRKKYYLVLTSLVVLALIFFNGFKSSNDSNRTLNIDNAELLQFKINEDDNIINNNQKLVNYLDDSDEHLIWFVQVNHI